MPLTVDYSLFNYADTGRTKTRALTGTMQCDPNTGWYIDLSVTGGAPEGRLHRDDGVAEHHDLRRTEEPVEGRVMI